MRNQVYDAVIDSPVGHLGIRLRNGHLRRVEFLAEDAVLKAAATPAARSVVSAIRAYFKIGRYDGALDLELDGTGFQRRVWKALQAIPAGDVITYGALARELGSSARAVGNACRRNPVPVLVPCHRVVAQNGLGGFAGETNGRLVEIKRHLLAHEGVEIGMTRPHIPQSR
jgi:methylated-DNA-[protein]-cysteine S-methyltransferase